MKCVLLLTLLISILVASQVAVADGRVDAHTKLLLTFNEGSGTTARDSSGNGNHGEIKGAQWVEGKFGHAVETTNDGDAVGQT